MYCNAPYDERDLYCTSCGFLLPHVLNDDATKTRTVGPAGDPTDLQWGTGYFHYRAKLFLRMDSDDTLIPIPLDHTPVVIGRRSEGAAPDVDLSPFGATDLGVSRRHVSIDCVRSVLQITDLASANGTFLNRDRLVPNMPYTLRNRAVLQLGKLILRVQFA